MQALRVDEEKILAAGDSHAEMIADALVQPMPRGGAQGGGQVDPCLGDRVVGKH